MNLPTRILRHLVHRGHAMLACELKAAFPGSKRPDAIPAAMAQLQRAGAVCWTTQGWLATDAGRQYVLVGARLYFATRRARMDPARCVPA